MFYFQQLLQQGLNGIDRTAMISTVVGVAYTILLIGFLIGLYQAALRGGDTQSLAVSGIKYVVIAIILANWSSVFRGVNDSCNQVAGFIDNSSGGGDMFLSWFDQLKQQFNDNGINAILPSISGGFAAITTALLILLSYFTYAVMVVIFAFFYTLFGCVLYVLGPLVLALLPIAGVGQLGRVYATNVMVWNAWGVLYAIFGSLITAIQFNRVDTVINQGFLRGFFLGSSESTILGLVSVFYAVALGSIPLIAKKVISGDVGSTAHSLVRAAALAAGALISGASGFAAGAGAGSEAAPVVSAGAGGAFTQATSSAAAASSSAPPPQPSLAQTIRSGIMSAVGSGGPPAPAQNSSRRASQEPARANSGASSPLASPRRSVPTFRPMGVTQTVAFHAGKFVGSFVGGSQS